MTDNRTVADILDEQRKNALMDRLKSLSALAGDELEGISIVTARDIDEVFAGPFEADYSHKAELATPAHLVVDLECLSCHQTIPDVPATLSAVTTTEKEGVGKVKMRLKADAQVHTCGQMALPKVPAAPEVEGQVGMDDPRDDEAEQAEAEAVARLEEVADDDLLPA